MNESLLLHQLLSESVEIAASDKGSNSNRTGVTTISEAALESLESGICLVDITLTDQPVIYCNSAFEKITGYLKEEVLGRNCRFLQGSSTDPILTQTLRKAISENRSCKVIIKNYRKNGLPFWNELIIKPIYKDGILKYYIGIQNDISYRKETEDALINAQNYLSKVNKDLAQRIEARTLQLKEANFRLKHDSLHDSLTGLANRVLLHETINNALLQQEHKPGVRFAVFYLDFDRFKWVNDSLGHTLGDELLIQAAKRLRHCVRPDDLVARLGGDEFAILIEHAGNDEELDRLAQRVINSIRQPFRLHGHEARISTSIGIVSNISDYQSSEDILRDADNAMYEAKAQGKARAIVVDTSMRERTVFLTKLEEDFKFALNTDQLEVFYQPILNLDAKVAKINSFEALIRWQHPRLGFLEPDVFLTMAQDSGLIIDLDRYVLNHACRQLKLWQSIFGKEIRMNVNLSAKQFFRNDFLPFLEGLLDTTHLNGSSLSLEITESLMIDDSSLVQANLRRIRSLGVELQIDDFGVGYSSLAYLHNLPVNTLKIDRSFIKNLDVDQKGAALVKGIIMMAHALDKIVIAEGVERKSQLDVLYDLECQCVQGFYFSKPMPASDLLGYLETPSLMG